MKTTKKINVITPIISIISLLLLSLPFAFVGEKYVIKSSEAIRGFDVIFGRYDVSAYAALFDAVEERLSLLRMNIVLTLLIVIAIGITTFIKRNKLTNIIAIIGASINLVILILTPYIIGNIGEKQTEPLKGIVTMGVGEVGYFFLVVVNILIIVISAIIIKDITGSTANIAFTIVNTIVLGIFVVFTLYPILNTLAVSFNDGLDALRGGIYLWPRKFTLENYYTVLRKDSLVQGAINSVARTVIGTFLHLFTTALLAYVLSRKEFLFNKQVSLFYVLTMYVSGGIIPTYQLFNALKLTNSFWVYIIPGMISAFNMIVIRTYMNGLPDSLVESAQVDGAGHIKIFLRIILPLCKPVLATVALFIAVGQWNSWFDNMLFNFTDPKLTTLQYELMKLLSSVSTQAASPNTMKHAASMVTPATIRASTTIITALPIVCLYPFLQRYFVSGLTIGGVKE